MTRFSPLDQTGAKVWVLYFEFVLVIHVINQHYLKCLYHFLFSTSWPPFLSFISIFIFRYLMNCIVILCVMMHIWELFINCIWKFGMGFFYLCCGSEYILLPYFTYWWCYISYTWRKETFLKLLKIQYYTERVWILQWNGCKKPFTIKKRDYRNFFIKSWHILQ